MVTTNITKLKPNVQYYMDSAKDCVVTLEKYENKTVFLKPVDPNQLGGYVIDDNGLIQFPIDTFFDEVFYFINV